MPTPTRHIVIDNSSVRFVAKIPHDMSDSRALHLALCHYDFGDNYSVTFTMAKPLTNKRTTWCFLSDNEGFGEV